MDHTPDPDMMRYALQKATAARRQFQPVTHVVRYRGGTATLEGYTRSLAIKAFCFECMGWDCNPKETCTSTLCPLFPFRGGRVQLDKRSVAVDEETTENGGEE